MHSIKRAFLYVTRKKGKTFILFTILLVMAVFVLTGISIGKASRITQQELRQKLGGKFEIAIDWENSPYVIREMLEDSVDENGKRSISWLMYSTVQFTAEQIAAVRDVAGVKYCDAVTELLVPFEELSLIAGTIGINEMHQKQTKVLGVWKTEEAALFTSGELSLTQGRHILPKDKHTAIISEDLAEESGLKMGDTITTRRYELDQQGYTGEEINVQIIGLFAPKEVEAFGEYVTTYDRIQNRVFVDLQTAVEINNSEPEKFYGFNTLNITVDDPDHMEHIITEITSLPMIDWKGFTFYRDNENYENAAVPLTMLNKLIVLLLWVIVAVSIVILALILTLWTKSRVHEIGIFLSVGIPKRAIIGQYLAEVILIAAVAFGSAYFISNASAEQIGGYLLEQSTQQNMQQNRYSDMQEQKENKISADAGGESGFANAEMGDAEFAQTAVFPQTELKVTVEIESMFWMGVIGMAVIAAAVGFASITVMYFKPQELLSKMS